MFLGLMLVVGTWASHRGRQNRVLPLLLASFVVGVAFLSFRAY
jgi:hypothetical protein